ncbi:hypothetical protein HELRODRAFT_172019 [Helobdella robusta]|uniref:Ricin B lectin domain-containing protein n=1 Tax=Helobdella robusta TaxID=6412 RepID=T1F4Y3_HELRO|nr:hypothetical protein HELRODRAFT_172019 [Helobdella robusta]ESO05006.1 hypothetical protein HELRODRAFT_172019 [Helobdella robusta]
MQASQLPTDHPFLLKNPDKGLYLSVDVTCNRYNHVGIEVNCLDITGQINQLWVFDADSSALRSKYNNFVLQYDAEVRMMIVSPFDARSYKQKWRYECNNIVSVSNPAFVLTAGEFSVTLTENMCRRNQIWIAEDSNDLLVRSLSYDRFVYIISSQLDSCLEVYNNVLLPFPVVRCWNLSKSQNQIWCFESSTGTIRTKLNNFVLEYCPDEKGLFVRPFNVKNKNQQWNYEEGRIISLSHPHMCLANLVLFELALVEIDVNELHQIWFFKGVEILPAPEEEEVDVDDSDEREEMERKMLPKVRNICPKPQCKDFMIQTAVLAERVLSVYNSGKNARLEFKVYLLKAHKTKRQLWHFNGDGFIVSSFNGFVFSATGDL